MPLILPGLFWIVPHWEIVVPKFKTLVRMHPYQSPVWLLSSYFVQYGEANPIIWNKNAIAVRIADTIVNFDTPSNIPIVLCFPKVYVCFCVLALPAVLPACVCVCKHKYVPVAICKWHRWYTVWLWSACWKKMKNNKFQEISCLLKFLKKKPIYTNIG